MGKEDAQLFFDVDPAGCLLCVLNDGHIPIGCISGLKYSDNKAFIGLYIMLPEHRGKGYGVQLFHRVQEHLAGYEVALDGVEAQIPNYERSGFHPTRWNMTYRCVNPVTPIDNNVSNETTVDVRDVTTIPISEWAASERASIGFSRGDKYYETLKKQSFGVCAIDKQSGRMVGMCLARQSALIGYVVGPWYCRDREVAKVLVVALLTDHRLAGQTITIEVPADNKDAVALLDSLGFKFVFKCNRMWTGGDRHIVEDVRTVYGHLSLALG